MLFDQTRQMKIHLVHGAIAGFEGQMMAFLPDQVSGKILFDDAAGPNAESILGALPVTPVFVASLQVMEVIKILLKKGKSQSGRMFYADLAAGEFNFFDFNA
jgi:molybdopterin/thiamine biosynthesis adenylyltransferase